MPEHRILIITNRVPFPLNDGGALAMHVMLESYYKAGWEVSLLSLNTSRHYVAIENLPELYRKIQFETYDINTDVKLMPTLKNFFLSRKPNHAERFYEKEFAGKIEKVIRNFDPEIVQLESIYLTTYLAAIKESTEAKIILRLHNVEFQIWERLSREASSFKKFYLKDLSERIRKFEIDSWKAADILITISKTDTGLIHELLPEKEIITVPFGIDPDKIPEKSGKEKWVGYHIGAMDWMPNAEAIKWFLEVVWTDLHKAVPDFKFYFAGRNMPGAFEKYEKDGVICAGEVPDAKAFISDKKVLIVPIHSGGGIRIKILEAMAAGKLVVSTSVGMQGITSAVPGIHYLLAEEKEDFIEKINWLMKHRQEAEAIAENGAELIRREYDQKKITSRLMSKIAARIKHT